MVRIPPLISVKRSLFLASHCHCCKLFHCCVLLYLMDLSHGFLFYFYALEFPKGHNSPEMLSTWVPSCQARLSGWQGSDALTLKQESACGAPSQPWAQDAAGTWAGGAGGSTSTARCLQRKFAVSWQLMTSHNPALAPVPMATQPCSFPL